MHQRQIIQLLPVGGRFERRGWQTIQCFFEFEFRKDILLLMRKKLNDKLYYP